MKILILNWRDLSNPNAGGAEVVTHQHAKAWIKAGHEVFWISSSFPGYRKEEIIDGVHFIRGGREFLGVHLFAFFTYFKKFINRIDLVIDEFHGIPFFTPLYVKEKKIAFIHEVAGEIWDKMYFFPINIIGKFLEKFYFRLYKNVKFWIDAPSVAFDLLKMGIPKKNITDIFCGINNKIKKAPYLKNKQPTFIFVSRLVKMKGVEEIIRAFYFIKAKRKDVMLWIIGRGTKNYQKKLGSLVKKLGLKDNVIFYGFVKEKKKLNLMAKAHLLLHASIKEGWGLVVVEAASQGTPSVVYNVSGLRDVVKHNKTGLVLDKNTPRQMAKEALKLFRNKKLYRRFQNNCLTWAGSLNWTKPTTKSLKLILEVANS